MPEVAVPAVAPRVARPTIKKIIRRSKKMIQKSREKERKGIEDIGMHNMQERVSEHAYELGVRMKPLLLPPPPPPLRSHKQ